ncbi:inositol monophosphatase [Kitasatospora sp. GAS1066B]|uniref:inositol monophosphatase family protein n=1 Tax=Kitasatospora sp. GAS1066B TaxID=3156271 RepID=UPI0035162CA3
MNRATAHPTGRWQQQLAPAVEQAAARLMRTWTGRPAAAANRARTKPDGTLVCDADTASEQILLSAIRAADPGGRIITEEDPATHHGHDGAATLWFIDPLDGTRQYLDGSPDFAILVSAWQHGAPVFSIAAFPAWDILALAHHDTLQLHPSVPAQRRPQPVHACYCDLPAVRECLPDGTAYLVDAFESTRALVDVARGSAAGAVVEMCGHRAWDIAAPCHLIGASGRTVTDETGKPICLDQPDVEARYLVAAATSTLHASLLTALENYRDPRP